MTWERANHDVSHTRGIPDGFSGHVARYLAERGRGGFSEELRLGTDARDARDMDALSGWVQMVAEA